MKLFTFHTTLLYLPCNSCKVRYFNTPTFSENLFMEVDLFGKHQAAISSSGLWNDLEHLIKNWLNQCSFFIPSYEMYCIHGILRSIALHWKRQYLERIKAASTFLYFYLNNWIFSSSSGNSPKGMINPIPLITLYLIVTLMISGTQHWKLKRGHWCLAIYFIYGEAFTILESHLFLCSYGQVLKPVCWNGLWLHYELYYITTVKWLLLLDPKLIGYFSCIQNLLTCFFGSRISQNHHLLVILCKDCSKADTTWAWKKQYISYIDTFLLYIYNI